ncbi:enoyl-CoA hydratase-related protein [Nocardioides sp.]|uniref:enoyl-CoA hydratase/isomerase family protein n=1 Tax=Nocardioides sp. TaxID=35761 RepID=UPI0032195A59
MTSSRPVTVEVVDGLARISLARPAVANAVDLELARALRDALVGTVDDAAVRVVLLRGEGRMFCGGGDVPAMAEAPDPGDFLAAMAALVHEGLSALDRLTTPVVCAVQGAAAGAGLALALAADLVVAEESAVFVAGYPGIGLTPDCGMTFRLPRVVGEHRAMDLLLTNRRLTAGEALDWGMVNRVVPDGTVQDAAWSLARGLADGPAASLGVTRRLVRASAGTSYDEHLDLEAAEVKLAARTAESQALVAAFARRAAGARQR